MNITPSESAQPSVYRSNATGVSIHIEEFNLFLTKPQAVMLRNKLNAVLRQIELSEHQQQKQK